MISYNENEKRKIIMDYYQNPRNRVESFDDSNYQKEYIHSSSCIDEITLYFNQDKTDFKFVAQGCAIFLSSCEIFIERIKELGFNQKDQIINNFKNLVNKNQIDNEQKTMLEKLNIYENVANHLNRKECALLICSIFEAIK